MDKYFLCGGVIKMAEIKTEYGIFTDLTDIEGNIIKTAQEYYEWQLEQNKIDICPIKTVEERLEELEKEKEQLKQENQLLHTQVEANATNNEFLEGCIMEMAQFVYA